MHTKVSGDRKAYQFSRACDRNAFSRLMLFRNSESTKPGDRQIFPEYKNSISILDAVTVYVNTAIGTGVLKLGPAWRCGAILASVVSAIICAVSLYGLFLFVKAAVYYRQPTLESCWEKGIGRKSSVISFLISFLVIFIVEVFYIQFICQAIQSLIREFWPTAGGVITQNYTIMGICTVLFFIPVVCISSPRTIVLTSRAAIVCIVYLSIHTIYWFVWHTKEYGFDPNHQLTYFRFDATLANCLSSLATAYLIAPVTFPGLIHITNSTPNRVMKTFTCVLLVCFVIYNIQGLFSYFTFFDLNEGGLILDYYPQTYYVASGKVAIIILMILSVPQVLNPARFVLINFIWKTYNYPKSVWIGVGICLYVIGVILSTLGMPWVFVMGFFVDTFAPTLLFMIPSILYLAAYRMTDLKHAVGAITMIVLGIGMLSFIIWSYYG